MEPKLIALKLVLDELGISDAIDTVDDRKRIQKAIYLAQLTRMDLGYRFGWYLKGPYSSPLARDYYALTDAISSGDDEYATKHLKDGVRERLNRVAPLLTPPEGVKLEDWLELVASYHFLRKVSGYDSDKAREKIREEKAPLSGLVARAEKMLQETGFLDPTKR